MTRTLMALGLLSGLAGTAHAQATALDGEARNYVVAPQPESTGDSGVLDALGAGTGYIIQGFFAPFRGLVYLEARWQALTRVKNLFVNEAETAGLYPTASYSSGFGLTYGAKVFVDNYFDAGEKIGLSAKTGGSVSQQYQLKAELPHIGGSPLYVETRVRYEENSNLLFAGIGNGSGEKTRFSQERFLTLLSTGVVLGDDDTRIRLGGTAIYNDRSFGRGDEMAGDPSIETVYDTSMLRGFDDGVKNLELLADVSVDTRDVTGPTHNGGVVRAFGGGGSLVDSHTYAHYGAEASYFVSPFWPGRVFVGRVALEGVVDRNNDMPFSELPRLGGAGQLRGYLTDQYRDKLSAIGTLEYHWPIHSFLSGDLFVETGKVASSYDKLLGNGIRDEWHVGYGGGLIVHSKSTAKVRMDVAYGDGLQVYFSTDVLDAFRKRDTEL